MIYLIIGLSFLGLTFIFPIICLWLLFQGTGSFFLGLLLFVGYVYTLAGVVQKYKS